MATMPAQPGGQRYDCGGTATLISGANPASVVARHSYSALTLEIAQPRTGPWQEPDTRRAARIQDNKLRVQLWTAVSGPGRTDQLSSRRRNAISCSSSRAEAATGMATSAPMMPSRLPPISTATRVTVAGTCTVRPITLGTMK